MDGVVGIFNAGCSAAGRLNGQACKADGANKAEGEREPPLPDAPVGGHVATEGSQGKDGRHEREEDDKEDKEIGWLRHLDDVCVLTIRVVRGFNFPEAYCKPI